MRRPIGAELDAFVAGVLDGAPLAPTGLDGLKAQLLADAATVGGAHRQGHAADGRGRPVTKAEQSLARRLLAASAIAREAGALAARHFRDRPKALRARFQG